MKFKKNDTQQVCVAKFFAIEGSEEKLLDRLYALAEASQLEGGCIRYELNQNMNDPREFTFIEKWCDQDSIDFHCKQSYFQEFFNNGKPEFVEKVEISRYTELFR